MSDLIIENGVCRSTGSAALKYIVLRGRLEGRTHMHKDGTLSFPESGHNVEVWKSVYPQSTVTKKQNFDDAFAAFDNVERPKFIYKREPLKWQRDAEVKLKKIIASENMHKAFAFFYDPGAGKSKSLTDMNTLLYCSGEIDAAIILTPNVLVGDQWSRVDDDGGEGGALQRDIHPSINYDSWLWRKTKQAQREYEVMLTCDGLQVVVMNIDAAKTPSGYDLLEKFIAKHKGRVNFAIDEAHLVGNPSSQRHKSCVQLASKCRWKSALTGTPITKDLISVFGIFRFLNPDILGYKYITGFKNQYCEMRWNGFADQIVGHKNIDHLYSKIDPYSSRISQEEMGLEKVYDEFVFEMSAEQKKHYDKLKTEWLTKLDNGEFSSASIALSAALKLQQISNGFLVGDDGTIQYLENARLKALDSWLETIPENEKVMVWCRFKIDAEILSKHFGKKAVDLSGNVDSKTRIENKDKFINQPEILYCIATPDAAGTGMDGLQMVCNRAVYYSSSENFVNRKQSEDRTLRVGGNSVGFYTDLVCKSSPDRKILRNLKGKKDLSRYTLDDIRELFA